MKNTKIVKARCNKTKSAFAIEIKQYGDKWKAVDFVKLTDSLDSKLESQVDLNKVITADNLQACFFCGNRVVGGCDCAMMQRKSCSKDEPYRYQCIYCKELKLDYSEASEFREGEKIILSQGQEVTLSRRGVSISNMLVGMGWKVSDVPGRNLDLDASVAMIDNHGELKEVVFFGNLSDKSNSINHHGDNLYGSTFYDGEKDDETISIDLSRIPQSVKCLAFIVNIYACKNRGQTFGSVRGMHIRLIEVNNKKVLAQYNAGSGNNDDTGIIIGAAYRVGSKWNFKAIGETVYVDDVHELAKIARDKCKGYIRS